MLGLAAGKSLFVSWEIAGIDLSVCIVRLWKSFDRRATGSAQMTQHPVTTKISCQPLIGTSPYGSMPQTVRVKMAEIHKPCRMICNIPQIHRAVLVYMHGTSKAPSPTICRIFASRTKRNNP